MLKSIHLAPVVQLPLGEGLTPAPFALPWRQWHAAAQKAEAEAIDGGSTGGYLVFIVEHFEGEFDYDTSGPFQAVLRRCDLPPLVAAARSLGFPLNRAFPDPESSDGVNSVRIEADLVYCEMAEGSAEVASDEAHELADEGLTHTPAGVAAEIKAAALEAYSDAKPWRTATDWQLIGAKEIRENGEKRGGVSPEVKPYLPLIVDAASFEVVWRMACEAPDADGGLTRERLEAEATERVLAGREKRAIEEGDRREAVLAHARLRRAIANRAVELIDEAVPATTTHAENMTSLAIEAEGAARDMAAEPAAKPHVWRALPASLAPDPE